MKSKIIIPFIKGLLAAYILSAIVILVLALIMFHWDVSEGVIRGGIIFTYVISCFVCGILVSRHHSGRKYVWGILAGGLYYLILLLVSMVCNHAIATNIPGIVPVLFFCLSGGMLGGMLGGMVQALR